MNLLKHEGFSKQLLHSFFEERVDKHVEAFVGFGWLHASKCDLSTLRQVSILYRTQKEKHGKTMMTKAKQRMNNTFL